MSEISIITCLAGTVPVGQLAVMAFGVGNTVYQAATVTQRCRSARQFTLARMWG